MRKKKPVELRLRLGNVSYVNMLPVRIGLEKLGIKEDFLGHPTAINKAIFDGKVDVAPVSSIFYALNKDKLFLLKDLGLSVSGKVKSVVLLSHFPFSELQGKRVCLTAESMTSAALTKVLFEKQGIKPHFFQREIDGLDEDLADAFLLIGDEALKANYYSSGKNLYLYDLAEEWFNLTGKPVVFALFVARRDAVNYYPEEVEKVRQILLLAVRISQLFREEIIERAKRITSLDEEFLADYYNSLKFKLGEEELLSLFEFYEAALPPMFQEKEFIDLKSSFEQVEVESF